MPGGLGFSFGIAELLVTLLLSALLLLACTGLLVSLSRNAQDGGLALSRISRQAELSIRLAPYISAIRFPAAGLEANMIRSLPDGFLLDDYSGAPVAVRLENGRLSLRQGGELRYVSPPICGSLELWAAADDAAVLGLALRLDERGKSAAGLYFAFGSIAIPELP